MSGLCSFFTLLIQSMWNLETWQYMSRQQICSFIYFWFFLLFGGKMTSRTCQSIAIERTLKIRDIAEIISQISLFNRNILIFEIWNIRHFGLFLVTKWRIFKFQTFLSLNVVIYFCKVFLQVIFSKKIYYLSFRMASALF